MRFLPISKLSATNQCRADVPKEHSCFWIERIKLERRQMKKVEKKERLATVKAGLTMYRIVLKYRFQAVVSAVSRFVRSMAGRGVQMT